MSEPSAAETLRELALAKFHAVFSSLSPSSTLEQFADRFFCAEELDVAREAISLASTLDRLGIAEVVVEA